MRMLLLFGFGTLITGCGYISDEKMNSYRDSDGDGYLWPVDCDDNDATLTVPQKWYLDEDGDGYGAEDNFTEACFAPGGAVTSLGDCNDTDASVYPNAEDVPYDGIDSNCDAKNDCDIDGDGYDGSAAGGEPTDACPDASDCDDSDPNIYPDPSVSEIFFNGVDDDCNLATGDGDADGDGIWHQDYLEIAAERGFIPLEIPTGQEGDCYDALDILVDGFETQPLNGFDTPSPAEVFPSATEIFYDGIDQNCDNADDFDQDGDGFPSEEWQDRSGNVGTDCVDSVDSENYRDFGVLPEDINPTATDIWYDGVDQDCMGNNDFDQDVDNYNIDMIDCSGVEASSCDFDGDGVDDFVGGGDCNDSDSSISLEAEEGVADGVDQNCDGLELCYEDLDGDSFGSNVEDLFPDLSCTTLGTSTSSSDCNDDPVSGVNIYPNAAEVVIDGIDQDCDGGDLCYVDSDGDGLGSTGTVGSLDLDCIDLGESTNIDDCNDGDSSIGILLWYPDNDSDNFGDMNATAVIDCTQPADHVNDNTDCDDDPSTGPTIFPGAVEICDGLDLSCNGSVPADETDDDGDFYVECPYDSATWQGDINVIGGGDCDDSNVSSYPNALELCDGLDNACTGSVPSDEADDDGDGYIECSNWVGETNMITGDCDTTNGSIYPGAPETSDPDDENCDGLESTGVSDCVSVEVSSKYFLICEEPLVWADAHDTCVAGGYSGLASITSATQNTDISNQVVGAFGDTSLWIGYNDQVNDGSFEWVNGSGVGYQNWAFDQPNGGIQENCVQMVSDSVSGGSSWHDADCLNFMGFICSINLSSIEVAPIEVAPSE